MKLLVSFMLLLVVTACSNRNDNLIWSDEFDGSGAPDSTWWSFDLGDSGWGNNEIQNYTSDLKNARRENGVLIIEAIKENGKWTSARLLSKGKYNFTHGKIVYRAKLPAGSGTWPALWLLGESADTIGWPDCGEIDVMEHIGKRPGIVQCALHSRHSFGDTDYVGYIEVPDFDSEFHTYEANRTDKKIEFSVDGKLYYTYEPDVRNEETWPFDDPFFIIMNIAMGGNLGSDPNLESDGLKNGIDPNLQKVRMEVDYVRVYSN